MDDQAQEMIRQALDSEEPAAALVRLVEEWKARGKGQAEIYDLFASFLEESHGVESVVEQDALQDVMDRIAGWTSPERRLFDSYLES